MNFVIWALTLSLPAVAAAKECRIGEVALTENKFTICRAADQGTQWAPPAPQEWRSWLDQFGQDAKFAQAIKDTTTLSIDQFGAIVDKKISEQKGMTLKLSEGVDASPVTKLADFLNEKSGAAAQAQQETVQATSEDKFLVLEQAAEKVRIGTSFEFRDMQKIAESNAAIIHTYAEQGCQAAILESKAGEPMRAIEFSFESGKKQKVLLADVKKTGNQYVVTFYGLPPEWDPTKRETRTITDVPGGQPTWSVPAFGDWPESEVGVNKNLVPYSADIGDGTASGMCKMAESAKSTWPTGESQDEGTESDV